MQEKEKDKALLFLKHNSCRDLALFQFCPRET